MQQQLIPQAQRSRYISRLYREVANPSTNLNKYLNSRNKVIGPAVSKSAGPEGKIQNVDYQPRT
jgi:hypothetical protein